MAPSNQEIGAGMSENPYEPPKAEIGLSLGEPRGFRDRPASGRQRSAPASEFSLKCQCGRAITVAGSQAGSTVMCGCGAEVKVPSLSRLRELSGKDRYESSICDTIRRLVQSGELPAGDTCAVSKKPTDDVIEIEILVPMLGKGNEGISKTGLITLLFGIYGLIYVALFAFYTALFGRPQFQEEGTTTVLAPIRVAQRYHGKVRRMSQARLKRLLRTVPVYARLLDENPYSRITIVDTSPRP